MKLAKCTTLFLATVTAMGLLSGCSSKGGEKTSSEKNSGKYDLKILNFKGEIADDLSKMCREYEKEFNVKVDDFTIGTGEDINGVMRAAMNSEDKPSLYSLGLSSLKEWKEGGFILDLNTIKDSEFKTFLESVSSDLALTDLEGNGSYGIPLCLEGYGSIVDTRMLEAIFGSDKVDAFLTNYKLATYDESEKMVKALDEFIKTGSAVTFRLNGESFTTQAKTGLAEDLNGVFAVAGADPWTYVGHFATGPIGGVFKTERDAMVAKDAEVKDMRGAMKAYVKALDLKTSYTAGQKNAIFRGDDYIQSVTNGYDQAVQNFALGRAIFLNQGTWAYTKIVGENAGTANTLEMVPFKFPLTQDDIKVDGYTPETINQDVVQLIPQYWGINAKVSEKEQKEAARFLQWMHTSETGRKYITETFKFIPYNATKDMDLGNSLNNSFMSYFLEGKTYNYSESGAPAGWSDDFGAKVKEEYLTKEIWTNKDIDALVDFAISDWIDRLN